MSVSIMGRQAVRVTCIVAVFVLGIGAFVSGVHTQDVPEMSDQGVLAWIYYCAGLFVLGGLDLGTPAGGPWLGRAALWIAFFLAPTVTATAVIEALLLLVRRERQGLPSLKGHVVLVGGARLARTYLQAIRAVAPSRPVLHVVPPDQVAGLERPGDAANVRVLPARITEGEGLEVGRLAEADAVIVIGEDDLLNLETAWAIKQAAADVAVAAHVTELTLLRPVTRMLRESASTDDSKPPLVFNTHRIAALHLYENLLRPHFEGTGYLDVFVIGGFGSFAQTILELLRAMAQQELESIVVVDSAASRQLRQFAADVSLESVSVSAVDGALEDPGTWARVDELLEPLEATPVYLLAAGDEVTNFRAAMLLRRRSADIRIFARCFRRSRFAETLAKQGAFELFAFEEVLHAALQEHFRRLGAV